MEISEITFAQTYLERFGYFESPRIEEFGFSLTKAFTNSPLVEPGRFDHRTEAAIKAFQRFNGLAETGELDEATLRLMETPRCGFPDVGEYVLQGNKWNKLELTYMFAEMPTRLDRAAWKAAIIDGLRLWQEASRLTFVEVSANADLVVRCVAGEHGDTFAFDGPSGVLAHAFFPPPNGGSLAGDAHFDDTENWVVSGRGTDVVTVSAHEWGHAFGLAHSKEPDSLMLPHYTGPHRYLSADDKTAIQLLYGAPVQPTPKPEPPPTPPKEPRGCLFGFFP